MLASALLSSVLVGGAFAGSQVLDSMPLVRIIPNWTPYIITAIAGMPEDGSEGLTEACEECNGTGRVGDGTVMFDCVVCDGTGKK